MTLGSPGAPPWRTSAAPLVQPFLYWGRVEASKTWRGKCLPVDWGPWVWHSQRFPLGLLLFPPLVETRRLEGAGGEEHCPVDLGQMLGKGFPFVVENWAYFTSAALPLPLLEP